MVLMTSLGIIERSAGYAEDSGGGSSSKVGGLRGRGSPHPLFHFDLRPLLARHYIKDASEGIRIVAFTAHDA